MGISDLEHSYMDLLHRALSSAEEANHTVDLGRPYIKQSLRHIYPLFVLLHAAVLLFGVMGNLAMMIVVVRARLYTNPLYFFVANLGLSDILKSGVVLPVTLANLLLQNWMFGSFLCFLLPMMQLLPVHASMLTYLMIAVHRYRSIVQPMRNKLPAALCTIAVWVVAVCVVLPYAVYIKYIDLEPVLGPTFHGQGICFVNLQKNVERYIRAMFVILFCLPLATIAFLYVKVSAELKSPDGGLPPAAAARHLQDGLHTSSDASYHTRMTWSASDSDNRVDPEGASSECGSLTAAVPATRAATPACRAHLGWRESMQDDDDDEDGELDVRVERRNQTYLILMVVLFAMCWCPIKILLIVTHFVYEDDENKGHFDITYLTFTFFGYLSTCINPVLFASWRMPDSTRDRLRGYFRFSNRRQSVSHSGVSTSRGTEVEMGRDNSLQRDQDDQSKMDA